MDRKFLCIFSIVFLALTIMPFDVFAKPSTNCLESVEKQAKQKLYNGKTTDMFRQTLDDAKLAVEDDTDIYNKYIAEMNQIIEKLNTEKEQKYKNDIVLQNVEPKILSCTHKSRTMSVERTKCEGKTLTQCAPEMAAFCLELDKQKINPKQAKQDILPKYTKELQQKICSSVSQNNSQQKPEKTKESKKTNNKCPVSHTAYNESTGKCEYKNQGPFPDHKQSCHNGTFTYVENMPSELKADMEKNFKEFQDGCKSLADCKNATEMTWETTVESDKGHYKKYACLPKTCKPDYPEKMTCGCFADEGNHCNAGYMSDDNQASKQENKKDANSELNAAYLADVNTLTSAYKKRINEKVNECKSDNKKMIDVTKRECVDKTTPTNEQQVAQSEQNASEEK